MSLKPAQLVLRCYAEPDEGSWFAMCIDLNLYARADSPEAVQTKLEEIIREYVTEALTDDRASVADLLPRPAPMTFRLRYHYIALHNRVCRVARNSARLFLESVPLIPAPTH